MPTPIHRQPTPIEPVLQRDPINPKWPLPYWSSHEGRGLIRLYHGNVTDVLKTLPAKSVHCVVTSPPYWGLRRYLSEGACILKSGLTTEEVEYVMSELEKAGVKPVCH